MPTACPTSSGWRTASPPRRTIPSAATTGRWCWSGDRGVALSSTPSSPRSRPPPDVNGYRQEGFAPFDRNGHRGRRLSAARAYLHPAMGRPNLEVETFALATRVLFEGNRAVGIQDGRAGRGTRQAGAEEIVLCGGAINSPQLLQ